MSGIREKISMLQRCLNEHDFRGTIETDVPLAPLTYYKVGGNAAILIEAGNTEDLITLKMNLDEAGLGWKLVGGGANLLVSDDGFDGIILKLYGSFTEVKVDAENISIWCGSAVPLSTLVREGCVIGMKGIERLAGIPGSVGGAIYMNAGTYREYMGGLTESVDILTEENTVKTLANNDCEFSYRTSRFQKTGEIILGCSVKSEKAYPEKVKAEIEKRLARRKETQPVEIPSCGCVFRNPEDEISAGFLIQEAGLKGVIKGGAMISGKHANFIVNTGNATASDILYLTALARKKVRELFGVTLRTEVELVGFVQPMEEILDALEKKL